MKKIRSNPLLRSLLIVLFLGFYIGNTSFIHTHHYHTYSVTHSHPFTKAADGTPDHLHSKAALDAIAQFNSFVIDIIPLLTLGIISVFLFASIRQRTCDVVQRVIDCRYLRGPPVLA